MAPPVIIYSSPLSGCARAVVLTAKNLKIDFVINEVDFRGGEHKQAWYKAIHPQGLLPALDDNGFKVLESRAISQYLVNSKAPGSSLYPVDAQKRAMVDQRLFFDACTFFPRLEEMWMHALAGGTEIVERNRNELIDTFEVLDKFLSGSKWLAGDEMTIADFHTLSLVAEMVHVGFPVENYVEVNRWWNQSKTEVIGFEDNSNGAKEGTSLLNSLLTGKKF